MPRIHTVDEDHHYFAEVIRTQQCRIAEIASVPVGFIAIHDSWVNHLYVLPKYHGNGIGSSLLNVAKEISSRALQLWTFQENLKARAFYGKHGFIEVELTDGAGNQERTPDVRLVWNSSTASLR